MFEVEFTNETVGDLTFGLKPGIIRPDICFQHEMKNVK